MYYLCELNHSQTKASYWDTVSFTHLVYPDGVEGDVELVINGQYEAIPQPKEKTAEVEAVAEEEPEPKKKGKKDD